ncbi:MAG: hypothetical protein VYE54_02555, partial [Pseudomonadota bacterium]|nr:hypothetical protein [Pseudomonadota bacterium]
EKRSGMNRRAIKRVAGRSDITTILLIAGDFLWIPASQVTNNMLVLLGLCQRGAEKVPLSSA